MTIPLQNPDRPLTPLHLIEVLLPSGSIFTIAYEPEAGDSATETDTHLFVNKAVTREAITVVKANIAILTHKTTVRRLTDAEWALKRAQEAQEAADAS
jgi:hypothetical protein